MQPQQPAAESSQDDTASELSTVQTAQAAGGAIVRRAQRRLGLAPGVIPLDVSQQLAARVARLAVGRLPLLESIQRRWGPPADAGWGNWPQLLYLRREAGTVAASAVETGASWTNPPAWPTRSSLPVVSAAPLTPTGIEAATTDLPAAQSQRPGAVIVPAANDLVPAVPPIRSALTSSATTAPPQPAPLTCAHRSALPCLR